MTQLRTGVPQQSVAREVGRLERAGVVVTTTVGSAKTIGIIPMLDVAFRDRSDVFEVFVFGSWASRFHGEAGEPPNDVDVAVVSPTLTRFDLAADRLDLEARSGLAVNLFVLEPWNDRLDELRSGSVPVFARVAA